MKKIIFIVLILVSIPAISQNNLSNEIYVSSGHSMPHDPTYFSKYWFNAFSLNIGVNHPVNNYIVLFAELGMNTYLFDEVKYRKRFVEYLNDPAISEDEMIVSGGFKQLSQFSYGVKIRFAELTGEKIYPYVFGANGVVINETDDLIIGGFRLEFDYELSSLYYAGLGIQYNYSEDFSFFIDGTYNYALTNNKNKEEIPIDLKSVYKNRELIYLYLRLGVAIKLPN